MFNNDFPYTSGIYCYVNLINDKKYVGLAVDLHRRIGEHENNFTKEDFSKTICGESKILWRAEKKYGRGSFIVNVIEFCETTKLGEREIFWIKELNSHVSKWGYNISWGGASPMIGNHHSEITKQRIRESTSGIKNHNYGRTVPQEQRDRISNSLMGENNPNWGTHRSEETKMRSRISNTGQTRTEETKRNIGNSKRGKFGYKSPTASSKYHGIRKTTSHYKDKEYVFWPVEIKMNGKTVHIKQFKKELDAAIFYDKYVIENKLNRPLNFPENYVNGVYNDK